MKQKKFVALILICVFLPISYFVVYQLGANSTTFDAQSKSIEDYQRGFFDGKNSTYAQQQADSGFSYSFGYKAGYQDGLKVNQNNNITSPTLTP